MLRTDQEALRDRAAEKTLQRIARDKRAASRVVEPLLAYIERHLFDEILSYRRMRRDCDIRDNNRPTVFAQEAGLTPAAYIRECRFEVACNLLRDSDLSIARIGALVGYPGPNAFGPAFRRWAGVTPARYRRRARKDLGPRKLIAMPADRPDLSPGSWRRFVEGDLGDGEASLLLRFLLDRYPACRQLLVRELLSRLQPDASPDQGPVEPTVVGNLRSFFAREDIERLMAEVAWEDLRDRPWAEMRDLVRHRLHFTTPALVEVLAEKSREEGRGDRDRGVMIARVALEAANALEGVGDEAGETPLTGVAWSRLGNAQRLALDFPGAERAFEVALRLLPTHRPMERGEALAMLATLRRWQRRLDEALELSDVAIGLLQGEAPAPLLASAFIQRAVLHRTMGNLAAAARDNVSALSLLDSTKHSRLYFIACLNHGFCLVEAKDPSAGDVVARIGELVGSVQDAALAARARWLLGRFEFLSGNVAAAERALLVAREMLEPVGAAAEVAVLYLDLAHLALHRNDEPAAIQFVDAALPIFESLGLRDDALAASVLRDEASDISSRLADLVRGGALDARRLARVLSVARRMTFDRG